MTSAILDQETRDNLRSKAELIEGLVERSADERPSAEDESDARRERRANWYRRVEDAVLDLANTLPFGTEDYEARQLFAFLIELKRAIEEDEEIADTESKVELAAMKMADVARRMERRLEHSTLEDPDLAAGYVFAELDSLRQTELARLLGVSAKTIGKWRAGSPVKQNAGRVKLIAQLVYYLRYSMTQTGLLMWFDNPADRFDGRSPRELVDKSVLEAWAPLIGYARGARGQLAG